ncbi:type VI secretion system ATPase TssH [Acidomonas methanolica]|uniref:ATP-dependent Clp protease ATP-binding subunit ClpB n=1 Tax=Acidomonas methanolica NBRC 104435 TaxID=1231351 RepID=A0A023D7C7_ACIMT|nr:type VI secretion system ATPase TssH [Acidomonas methanolica]MBU2652769.1 type VI secretion system ATPase TssH [Acidomonas methanolica]TCS31172.1 type VI secretion system protein VasG [Acidomonas methanolica]GAJ30077.1 ATP-dependent Clp protease ATP-binding subunit ClpB [Acidomonas methanolica NBRC 104435]GBQ51131.1 ATPase [Acidomonas methanolica]GEK98580.1 ClpV1 family T6SS ATPase [Acidomonas methanolica NBRC 104435]
MAAAIDLPRLIERLDDAGRRALEAAAGTALSRTHYTVEIEHWLLQILQADGSDVSRVLAHEGIGSGAVAAGLNAALDRFSTGNGRSPALAPELVGILKDAWLIASVDLREEVLRSGHVLCACLGDEVVASRLKAAIPALRRLSGEMLVRDFARLTAGSSEEGTPGKVVAEGGAVPAAPTGTPALDRFTTDLVALARAGRIDPILGRDREIRQIVDILTRRRQNNPILTGEAGVGKTAVVEGLALRIAVGDVPDALREVAVRTLDLGLLQAGAGVKGEFENRLHAVIDEIGKSATPVLLFIDEAHTLIGTGGQPGQGDAANLLKPPLARGELRVIAATTRAEYKRYFEKDAALTRRFQMVQVEEPAEPVALDMIRGLVTVLETHHGVRILAEAVEAAVRLSSRYIPDRQLPDKAVSLLDTACARVAMSQASTPGSIESRRRRIVAIEREIGFLEREERSGACHEARLSELRTELADLNETLVSDERRFAEEAELVAKLAVLRDQAESATDEAPELRRQALDIAAQLQAVQGDHPMIHPVVDAQVIAEVVENWTGVPARRMRADEVLRLLRLEDDLRSRVVGQDHALQAVAQAIRVSRAGLTDPRKPVGVFLMVGTSGVGKTETAAALADLLYGGPQSLTTINMTEFKEEHKVSLLMGSPPGYVGYGEGGILTEAVRRRPHSVLLLDEFEKAHPGVQDVFFQVFDKGTMKDGEGRDIDFRNTVVIMTTNAGTQLIDALFADPDTAPGAEGLAAALHDEMLKHFKAAFLGRVTTVPYLPLSEETRRRIVGLQIGKVIRRVADLYGLTLEVDENAADLLAKRSGSAASGARVIERTIAGEIMPLLASRLLGQGARTQGGSGRLSWHGGWRFDLSIP